MRLERARGQDAVEPERVPLTDLGREPGLDPQAGRVEKDRDLGAHQEARAADPSRNPPADGAIGCGEDAAEGRAVVSSGRAPGSGRGDRA